MQIHRTEIISLGLFEPLRLLQDLASSMHQLFSQLAPQYRSNAYVFESHTDLEHLCLRAVKSIL